MSPSTFRETVALVAARAKEKLPEAVNGRVESAVKLVLGHDVELQADGSILVGSSSDPMKTYRLQGTACTCQDFAYGKAPGGWCAHRIAAGIHKRVQEELARSTTVEREVILPEPMEPYPDNDAEGDPKPQPAPQPLPEAPVSITLKAMLHGHEVLVTLRGTDFASVREQVEAASAWLKAQAPQTPAGPQGPGEGWCAVHQVPMVENAKNGQRWFSHRRPEGGFCKGR